MHPKCIPMHPGAYQWISVGFRAENPPLAETPLVSQHSGRNCDLLAEPPLFRNCRQQGGVPLEIPLITLSLATCPSSTPFSSLAVAFVLMRDVFGILCQLRRRV
mgnify:CR=1 FL=1